MVDFVCKTKSFYFFIVQLVFPIPPIILFCPTHPHLPHSILPTSLSLSLSLLYMFFDHPSPSFPCYPPPPSSLVTVSLLFPCLWLLVCFVDQVPLKIIWYLSSTAWLTSLSIMLSSSIHAVPKGRSSFFLSDV